MRLSERDQRYIWHPFTPQITAGHEIPIVRGEGALLFDENDRGYIDGIASWWVNLHGHCNAHIAARVGAQLQTLEHAIFSGFTHQPAVDLAEGLLKQLPFCEKVFYSDDGSTAVEVALKMALQYWSNKGQPRTKIIAFENAYHGDTFGGMSVAARNVFNKPFERLLFDVIHIPVPVKGKEQESRAALERALADDDIAAFIFEPLVQGAAGMIMYDAAPLDALLALCKKKNVPCIADEVMTGFGRTGTLFAAEQLQQKPDIVCLSKGLTGGFLPLGVTACAGFIHDAFRTSDRTKTFFHGHSYTANPTACAAAVASLEISTSPETAKHIERIATAHRNFAASIALHPALTDVRCCGVILALEIRTDEARHYLNAVADRVADFFLERNIILRPLGNVVYVLPPYVITDAQLETVYAALREFLSIL